MQEQQCVLCLPSLLHQNKHKHQKSLRFSSQTHKTEIIKQGHNTFQNIVDVGQLVH